MKLAKILPFTRTLMNLAVNEGDIAVDATVGNGHDTLYLAQRVGESGHVFGFDIQKEAIAATSARLQEHNMLKRVTLFQASHDQLIEKIPAIYHGRITGAIFNLGYLPGGDKRIVTKPDSTIRAIEQLLQIMAKEGIIVVVVYHGHPEGVIERDALLHYTKAIDQKRAHVLKYEFINQMNNPPFIIALEKRA
ncbi:MULTISPECIES: class I SAM-dependent methyltransferase [Parageobacillus]|jgi:16S rRNA C1402 N4-methylase RsmH|uniref:rRNA methyltransferase n=1 Tax=Parageobacillus thermoglucosidasius TaxID=1426 RepID=A0A1B7KVT7_PARTM|nr:MULTISPECIES: class I SAM-dependent methyltransferase [Parageobacillus]OAT74171.1 rRNA methyltransferase [Parageobacillus thermoglucosidasius]BDG46093.1 rRNA methyltransferase [Parageobacillus sp. KH3-4]